MSTMDEILGESESTEPQFLFSTGTTTSANKNVLLTGTEIATLSTLKQTTTKECAAYKKRAAAVEDVEDPEAPFIQGPRMNRKERREAEKARAHSDSEVIDGTDPFFTSSKLTSAEKAAKAFGDKLSTFHTELDDKFDKEKKEAAAMEQRREENNNIRFQQMLFFQAQQASTMMKMIAMVMNPSLTPEQAEMFNIPVTVPPHISTGTFSAEPVLVQGTVVGAAKQDSNQLPPQMDIQKCQFPTCNAPATFGFRGNEKVFCFMRKVDEMV